MNPENCSTHIQLRHSLLWRKPLPYDLPSRQLPTCHSQINAYATIAQSHRHRTTSTHSQPPTNSRPRTNKTKTESSLNEILDQTNCKPTLRQSMIRTLKTESSHLQRMPTLIEGIRELKNLRLMLDEKPVRAVTYSSKRTAFVRNDYHSRITNPGFGRSHQGRFYTK